MIGAAAVQPFPFASLEALTAADVAAGARLRRVARELIRLDAIETAIGKLAAICKGVGNQRRELCESPVR